MKIQKNTLAFTLVELVVVATILVILTSIWFYSYVWNLQDSRDSARKADIARLSSSLNLYHQKRWAFPNPWNSFGILNDWLNVANQWKMNESVPLSTLDTLVYDPKTKKPYSYSITTNKQEFQVAGTLENADNPHAILDGNYTSVSVNILPTILLASDSVNDLEIADGVWAGSANRTLFIFNEGGNNLPYDFDQNTAYSESWVSFDDLLNDPLIKYWQNSDFRSCTEILEAGKSIWNNIEYQVLDASWTLSGVTCTNM